MIKPIKFMAATLCAATVLGFASCSDDDDEPTVPGTTIEEVFPAGLPTQIGDTKITTNANGQVTKIEDGSESAVFEYGTFSRATEYQVKMTVSDTEYPEDNFTIYMQLNGQGFVSHALQVYADGEEDTWDFGYNGDGQLNSLKRSEGGDEDGFEITEMTYTAGNITSVKEYETRGNGEIGGDAGSTSTIEYTTSSAAAIDNKGGLMMFDDMFGVDMDEMGIAYFAGLLGKATKQLPLVRKYDGETDYYSYAWTINAAGLPTKMVGTYHYDGGSYEDESITFKW